MRTAPNNDSKSDSDEKMLDYLRAQEAELLLAMSRTDPRSPEYQ